MRAAPLEIPQVACREGVRLLTAWTPILRVQRVAGGGAAANKYAIPWDFPRLIGASPGATTLAPVGFEENLWMPADVGWLLDGHSPCSVIFIRNKSHRSSLGSHSAICSDKPAGRAKA